MIRTRAELTVERARVRRAAPDSRAHLETALARVSPTAVGVPPGALLVIRRLAPRVRLGPGMRTDAFVTDLQETLRERLARARAPGAGGGGGDLLFRDDADLAAAVIASWLDGSPPDARMWRRLATGGEPPPAWWRHTVLPDPRLLPRTIAALLRLERAAAWLAVLEPGEIGQATRMLAAAHGATLTDPPRLARPVRTRTPRAQRAEARAMRDVLRTVVPEASTPTLTVQARTLLAVALVLERRPALVRERAFASSLAAFVADAVPEASPLPDTPPRAAARPPQAAWPAPRVSPESALSAPVMVSPFPAPAPATPVVAPVADAAVETGFGGMFFLLNALLAMEVYDDFTRPLSIPDAPAPFDLLALLGRRWFGARFRRDPLDPLLATVAGRAPDEPPCFSPPRWRVPDAWLAPWPEPAAGVWHPAGFPLDLAAEHPRLPRRAAPRWVAALALYLEARLARALDTSGRAAVRMTCRRLASVALDGDRMTVTFALAAHPLALRRAGLDRDPGYLPAARRAVAFVFA